MGGGGRARRGHGDGGAVLHHAHELVVERGRAEVEGALVRVVVAVDGAARALGRRAERDVRDRDFAVGRVFERAPARGRGRGRGRGDRGLGRGRGGRRAREVGEHEGARGGRGGGGEPGRDGGEEGLGPAREVVDRVLAEGEPRREDGQAGRRATEPFARLPHLVVLLPFPLVAVVRCIRVRTAALPAGLLLRRPGPAQISRCQRGRSRAGPQILARRASAAAVIVPPEIVPAGRFISGGRRPPSWRRLVDDPEDLPRGRAHAGALLVRRYLRLRLRGYRHGLRGLHWPRVPREPRGDGEGGRRGGRGRGRGHRCRCKTAGANGGHGHHRGGALAGVRAVDVDVLGVGVGDDALCGVDLGVGAVEGWVAAGRARGVGELARGAAGDGGSGGGERWRGLGGRISMGAL